MRAAHKVAASTDPHAGGGGVGRVSPRDMHEVGRAERQKGDLVGSWEGHMIYLNSTYMECISCTYIYTKQRFCRSTKHVSRVLHEMKRCYVEFASDGNQAQLEQARDAAHNAEQAAVEARTLQLTHQKVSSWTTPHLYGLRIICM